AAEKMPLGDTSTGPIDILKDDLNDEDLNHRINAIKRLPMIALCLGKERTLGELIPFLNETIYDETEVLLVLADQLGKFTSLVGGPENAMYLIPILESLATVTDCVVRSKAIESLCTVIAQHSAQDLLKYVIPMMRRLTNGSWFTFRISACGLFATCYPRVSEQVKAQLRSSFYILCKDTEVIVRKEAAISMVEFTKVMEGMSRWEFLPSCAVLTMDKDDTVAMLAVESYIMVAQFLTQIEVDFLIWPTIRRCAKESSWAARYMVAEKIVDLQKAVYPKTTLLKLVKVFQKLLKDTEVKVRTAAASKVSDFCANLYKAKHEKVILSSILPCARDLVSDPNVDVRSALASVIMNVSSILGASYTVERLLPMFYILVKDENPQVRLNLISNLKSVNEIIGIQQLSNSLLPAIVELYEDPSIEIHLGIIGVMPTLAGQFGQVFFDKNLTCLFMGSLRDPVYGIRETAVINLKKLVAAFGVLWAEEVVIPGILTMPCDPEYSYRMTYLFCVNFLAEICGIDINTKILLPRVLQLAGDPVAIIRFNVAKTLEKIFPFLEESVIDAQLKPTLDKLITDRDVDVKFFAAQAIAG
ncbi:hypothetical protein KR200_011948, partial [Drosophila serrata]